MDEKTRQSFINATDVIDEDDYSWGDSGKIDIKKIIFAHINRISETIFKGDKSPNYSEKVKDQVIVKGFDKRETIIEAINFLMAIIEPYYDEKITEAVKNLQKSIDGEQEKLFNFSLEKEAQQRADNDYYRFKIDEPSEFGKLVEHWKKYLKDNNYVFYDKDSAEYEYFIDCKYSLMMNIFYEINHLLFRQDYLETAAYSE